MMMLQMFQFRSRFKMDPVLTSDAGSDQPATHIASRQCDEGVGAGAQASYYGKTMIAGAIG